MSLERETIERAQGGDAAAFGELVDLYYDLIFRFSLKYTGQRQDAEDVAQQACIKLAKAIGSYRFESAFSTWLYTLVMNCARDWYRQQRRHEGREEAAELAVSAGEVAESAVFLRQVLDRVSDMGDGFRDALVLVAGEGMSHREAAGLLGVKESTVSWRLHEIRRRLGSLSDDATTVVRGDVQ